MKATWFAEEQSIVVPREQGAGLAIDLVDQLPGERRDDGEAVPPARRHRRCG